MSRHDKHSEEEFEDHGVLDAPVVDTTALNVLGLPTEQVRINLPRGYEDLDDDEDVVDDVPEGLAAGSIVLELPSGASGAEGQDADEAPRDADDPGETPEDRQEQGDAADDGDSREQEPSGSTEAPSDDEAGQDDDQPAEAETPDSDDAPDEGEDGPPADETTDPASDEEQAGAEDDGGDAPSDPHGDEAQDETDAQAAEPEAEDVPAGESEASQEAHAEPVDDTEEPPAAGAERDADDDAPEAQPMTEHEPLVKTAPRFLSQPASGARAGAGGESASQLTSDRLLEPTRRKPRPEGAWRGFWYSLTGGVINLGDSRLVRERKDLLDRIASPLPGRARFVPVLSRKGGVGKTTVTTLLGMAMADARDDRIVAVDANPDRGTLSERIATRTTRTVRDVVRRHDRIRGYADISDLVARDSTRLDIVASDTDPHVADAFDDADYRTVTDVASRYYSMVLTDTGTGIIHSVMGATLDLADQIVIVAGASVDESRLASETLTWLEAHGREDLVRGAVVVLNQSSPGKALVRIDEVEAHFASRVRAVVRLPYDESLATGGAIVFDELREPTRHAARKIAASVIEGMRSAAISAVEDDDA